MSKKTKNKADIVVVDNKKPDKVRPKKSFFEKILPACFIPVILVAVAAYVFVIGRAIPSGGIDEIAAVIGSVAGSIGLLVTAIKNVIHG